MLKSNLQCLGELTPNFFLSKRFKQTSNVIEGKIFQSTTKNVEQKQNSNFKLAPPPNDNAFLTKIQYLIQNLVF